MAIWSQMGTWSIHPNNQYNFQISNYSESVSLVTCGLNNSTERFSKSKVCWPYLELVVFSDKIDQWDLIAIYRAFHPKTEEGTFFSSFTWYILQDISHGRPQKKWCFWTVVLEKTLESPLTCKEIKPVNPKRNESWIFIGRTDAEAGAPIVWSTDAKNWHLNKDPDSGKDWRQEEKGTTEDEMVGWHHWLNGQEFKQALGVDDGQGSLACCSPWGHKESDMAKQLNWTDWI